MIPRFVENVQQGKSTLLVTWKFHRRYKFKRNVCTFHQKIFTRMFTTALFQTSQKV